MHEKVAYLVAAHNFATNPSANNFAALSAAALKWQERRYDDKELAAATKRDIDAVMEQACVLCA